MLTPVSTVPIESRVGAAAFVDDDHKRFTQNSGTYRRYALADSPVSLPSDRPSRRAPTIVFPQAVTPSQFDAAFQFVTPLQVAQMPDRLRALLDSEYAYLVLLGVFVLEGAMLMYFMPSELIVPGALLLMGDTVPEAAAIIGVAVFGATIGQYALFKLAQRGGREYLLEKRWFRISEDRLDRFDGWFERWGPIVVPVSNSLLFTRGMLTVPAGLAGMDDRQFVVLSAVGTLSFQLLLATLYVGFDTLL